MKKILFLVLFVRNLTLDGQQISKNYVDDFTGTRHVWTSPFNSKSQVMDDFIDRSGGLIFALTYSKSKEGIVTYGISLGLYYQNLGCLSEHSGKAILLFDDNSTMEITQVSSTECGMNNKYTPFYIFASRNYLNSNLNPKVISDNYKLVSKKYLKKIRIYTSEAYMDYEILPEKTSTLIKHSLALDKAIGEY